MNGRNGSKLDADLLTAAEIELLIWQCSRRAPTGVRNRALIAVCWRCGLRIGEALALAPKDFDPDSAPSFSAGRGGNRRVVGVDAGTVAIVGRWLDRRRKLPASYGAPLFCTLAGWPMDQSYIRHLLPRLGRKAGIEPGARARAPPRLRGRPRPLGRPLYVVRDALGHASVATTKVYLSRVGVQEAVEAMRNREWSPE